MDPWFAPFLLASMCGGLGLALVMCAEASRPNRGRAIEPTPLRHLVARKLWSIARGEKDGITALERLLKDPKTPDDLRAQALNLLLERANPELLRAHLIPALQIGGPATQAAVFRLARQVPDRRTLERAAITRILWCPDDAAGRAAQRALEDVAGRSTLFEIRALLLHPALKDRPRKALARLERHLAGRFQAEPTSQGRLSLTMQNGCLSSPSDSPSDGPTVSE